MPAFVPPSQFVAYPNDTITPTFIVQPSTPSAISIDFSNYLGTGDYIAAGNWTVSGTYSSAVTVTSSSSTSTVSTVIFSNTLLTGQYAVLSCMLTSANGLSVSRSARVICEQL